MKNFKYLLLLVIAFNFLGCNDDFLDRNPQDKYSNTSLWSTESDVKRALNGCYSGWEDASVPIYMDCASDNGYARYYWEGYTELGNGSVTPESTTAVNRWSYGTIQNCNWFMENVKTAPISDALKEQFIAEVKFLRAYRYYVMTQVYGDVPLVTKTLSIEEANKVSRTPLNEVREFILNELEAAAKVLPESYPSSETGHITKGAALALKARLYLYMGNYADAAVYAQKVMDLNYALFPNYQDLFRIQNENNSEVILDIQHIENDYSTWLLGVIPSSGFGGWGSISPTQALVDAYEMSNGKLITDPTSGYNVNNPYVNRDPRLTATVVYPGQLYEDEYFNSIDSKSQNYYDNNNNGKTGYLVKKLTSHLSDFPDIWNAGLNIILIRYAEILLTYAEAKIETNVIDSSVYDAINKVRKRAGMPEVDQTVYNNQAKLRELVRRERRIELAMEGLRWFDVQRWKIGESVMAKPVYGVRKGTVNETTGELALTGDNILVEDREFNPAKNYLWPVPQKEIDVNKNIIQNPGF